MTPALLLGCAQTEEPESAAAPVVAAEPEPEIVLGERIAADGRPEWWFPEPEFDAESVTVCVETIAYSLRDAREAAIALGRERARLWIESRGRHPIAGTYEVKRVWAWPLPDLPGREERYAGYALVRLGME